MKKAYKKPEVQYSVESNTLEDVFACIRPNPGSGRPPRRGFRSVGEEATVVKTSEFDPWVKK